MKKAILLSFVIAIGLASCDKKNEGKLTLTDLKTQKTELEAKIKEMEKNAPKDTSQAARIVSVAVSPITLQNFKHFVEVQGMVESENILQVTPQMGGAITGIFAKEGQLVGKGQLVATIDNQVMRESIAEIKNQLELATVIYNKQKALWDQQIGTEVAYLQTKGNKEGLEKRITTMQTQMGMSKVFAPISGTVEIVRQKVGEMGMPGVPMMQIVNLTNLKATGKVPDSFLASVKKGQSVTIVFPDLKKEINGKISNVNALVDPISRTFGIESKIPNVGGQLKPNQIAILKVNDLAKANSIVIDQNLIQKTELGDIVYVIETEGAKKTAKSRKVKMGITYNGQVEITEGLKEGDMLVTQGFQELVDGTVVNF